LRNRVTECMNSNQELEHRGQKSARNLRKQIDRVIHEKVTLMEKLTLCNYTLRYNRNFYQKIEYILLKIEILGQTYKFGRHYRFWSKLLILVKITDFGQN